MGIFKNSRGEMVRLFYFFPSTFLLFYDKFNPFMRFIRKALEVDRKTYAKWCKRNDAEAVPLVTALGGERFLILYPARRVDP